jgi:hypothetical protein
MLRWAATAIAAAYLAYRAVVWLGLVAIGFPPSVLPFVLLVGAVLVDVAVTARVPGWLAGPVVVAVVYAAAFVQEDAGLLPPWSWASGVPVAVAFGLLWAGVDVLARSAWLARWREPVAPGASSPVGAGPTVR